MKYLGTCPIPSHSNYGLQLCLHHKIIIIIIIRKPHQLFIVICHHPNFPYFELFFVRSWKTGMGNGLLCYSHSLQAKIINELDWNRIGNESSTTAWNELEPEHLSNNQNQNGAHPTRPNHGMSKSENCVMWCDEDWDDEEDDDEIRAIQVNSHFAHHHHHHNCQQTEPGQTNNQSIQFNIISFHFIQFNSHSSLQ